MGVDMGPVTWTVIGIVAALGAGFGAGWSARGEKASKSIEAQSELIENLQQGQADILSAAQKPVVLDAQLKAQLAEVPVQCQKELGGDPMSVPCQWATCVQHGTSSAQRPECSDISDLMVEVLKAHHAPRSPEQ